MLSTMSAVFFLYGEKHSLSSAWHTVNIQANINARVMRWSSCANLRSIARRVYSRRATASIASVVKLKITVYMAAGEAWPLILIVMNGID